MQTVSRPKRHPLQESGLSRLPAETHGAVPAGAAAARGDTRRMTRGGARATALAQPPPASLPDACGPGARRTAADRVVSTAASAPHDLLHSPVEATSRRLEQRPWGLAGHDPPAVDWTSPRATQGVGPRGQTACPGLHVHSPLALTPARVPVGRWAHQVWGRERTDGGTRARRTQRPRRQQERPPWRSSLDAVFRAPAEGPTTRVVRVGERDVEVDDVVAAARPEGVERW
ncbi:MAG: hypothetical protein ACRERE_40025, partial [Candidatus Entotheonellia bacterium]